MKIRPKNMILFAAEGVRFSLNNLRGANWRQQVFNNYRLHLLDLLAKYGEAQDYGQWLNEMQERHANIYNLAGGKNGNWENQAYKNDLVALYLQDYKGGIGNDGQYKRFGTFNPNSEDRYDFNLGISPNYGTRYNISNPPKRISGDRIGEFKVDGLYSAITDDRRLLGREGDWDELSLNEWNSLLKNSGWEMYLDSNDKYYKLRRLSTDTPIDGGQLPEVIVTPERKQTDIPADGGKKYGFDWNKIKEVGAKIFGNPDLYGIGRLAGNLNNNNRVYDEALKAIRPVLRLTYNTHRQVVGDEATKQAYYRRAVLGQTKAARPFTSDADRLMAYQFEAKRVGDELRALGDLADNQEIRRTSDESNQHEWANTQRATEVANANIASLNQTNAAKHNLLALKHSALWSSIDNYLKEIEYRKRQQIAEKEALDDQIYALTRANEIENDPELLDLLERFEAASKKPENLKDSYGQKIVDLNSEEIKGLINQINQRKRLLLIETYQLRYNRKYNNNLNFLKSGSKVIYKKKDDLLYKSTKDVVEHFRKMSKMSSDASNKKIPKIEKLTSHPKGKARKYQLGGLAPFTVYTPVAMGGETSRSSEYGSSSKASSSSKNNEGKETLDLVKSLFEKVLGKGLPIDVNSIYAQMSNLFSLYKAFGKELDTDDIAMLYLQSMQSLSNVMYSKEAYDKAKLLATQNEALDEFAVNALGHFVVQDTETGKISTEKSWEDVLKSGKNPITNAQLLHMRAYNPELSSQRGDELIERVVNNGMGINKIGAQIKALAGNIGSYEGKIEGLTQVESNQVKSGLLLLANAPDGYYKHTVEDKNQQTLMRAAIGYITNMLSPSQRAILDAHGGADKLIPMFLASQENITHNVSFLPLTGKTSDKNSNGSGGKGDSDNSAGLAFVLGQGPRELISFNTGTSNEIEVLGIKGVLLTKSNENLGQGSTLQDATKSLQGGYLLWNKATFGGSRLNPSAYNHIILNDSTILGVDLPYTKDVNGNEVPNFLMLRKMEQADDDIRQNNITDIGQINLIYIKYGLDPKYTPDGKLNLLKYRRFAAIQATLDELSLQNKDAILSDEVALAGEVERDLYKEIMKKSNKDYDLDDGFFGYFKDNLYKGTIFIPYSEDIAFAALSSGQPFNLDLPNNVTTIQEKLYAPKISQYVSPQATLSLVKNN